MYIRNEWVYKKEYDNNFIFHKKGFYFNFNLLTNNSYLSMWQ